MPSEIILEMKNITKDFPGVWALDDINFELRKGEIHALVGENGAGKSTLMSVLSGVHTDFLGTIIMDGRPVRLSNPKDAIEHGVGIIYQELDLIPYMTLAEKIALGREPLTSSPYSKRTGFQIRSQVQGGLPKYR